MKTKHYGWFFEKYGPELCLLAVFFILLAIMWGTARQIDKECDKTANRCEWWCLTEANITGKENCNES